MSDSDLVRVGVTLGRLDDTVVSETVRLLQSCAKEQKYTPHGIEQKAVSLLCGGIVSVLAGSEQLPKHHKSGQPYLPDMLDYVVGISHTGRQIALSIERFCHGIDIELQHDRNARLYRHTLCAEELCTIERVDREGQQRLFLELWTRKESLIKCGAITLGQMKQVCVLEDTLACPVDGVQYGFATRHIDDVILSVCVKEGAAAPETLTLTKEVQYKALELLLKKLV